MHGAGHRRLDQRPRSRPRRPSDRDGRLLRDYRDIKAAAVRLFSYRNGHPWPPTVTARDGWADRYVQETASLDVIPGLDATIAWTNDLLARIDGA